MKTCYVVSRIKFALLRKSSGGTAIAINLIIHSFSGFVSRSGLKKNSADLSEAATQLKEERSITLIKPILYPQFWESVKTPMIVNDQTCWTVPKKSLQVHRYLMYVVSHGNQNRYDSDCIRDSGLKWSHTFLLFWVWNIVVLFLRPKLVMLHV